MSLPPADDLSSPKHAQGLRRALAAIGGVIAGAVLLSLLLTLLSGRLERPFTRMVGKTVEYFSEHVRVVAVISVAAFVLVWAFIGLVCLLQARRERAASRRGQPLPKE
jgi:hypothetical protein